MSTNEYNSKPVRVNLKKLVKENRQLKRQVRQENKRRETIDRLQKENDALNGRLLDLKDDSIPFVNLRNSNSNNENR